MSEMDRLFQEAQTGLVATDQVEEEHSAIQYRCPCCGNMFAKAQFMRGKKGCKGCRKKAKREKEQAKFQAAKKKYKGWLL